MMRLIPLISICFISFTSISQVLEVSPSFPTIEDNVTIVFNALEGNAELAGESPVYGHMGVITDASTGPTDWQFVQGEWGTADATTLMTDLGNDRHSITIDLDQFYGFPMGTVVERMAFVFRNADGSLVGRAEDGSDIFYDVYPVGTFLQASILSPSGNTIVESGENLTISGESSIEANLTLTIDASTVASVSTNTVLSHTTTASGEGTHEVIFTATSGSGSDKDTIYYTVPGTVVTENPPAGMRDGINYLSPTSMLLQLHAPQKDFVYIIGDFNNWMADQQYFMKRADDGETWWLQIDGLTADQRVAYQYWVDGDIKVADPCSPLILDPNNDGNISALAYPNPHPYPSGKTTGFCTLAHPGATDYVWQVTNFQRPEKKDLRIYELLMRDFVSTSSYVTLMDSLDYLENLGINAIEIMPPGEFENNDSWGYSPSFHMALDKYYGTPDQFKALVDECHSRGMAVIVDMVLNHAFGQSPLVHLYWENGAPAANSPWFNTICPHEPFCWGYDFNHTTAATQRFVDRVNSHWIEEYNIDGFRFDFTQGFTQSSSGGAYNSERIGLIQRMADYVWSVDSESYVILEHWTDNSEEEVLADYGCMLWANATFNYQEAAMGYLPGSNFQGGIYVQRGWSVPHLITYMESHDEERVSYKMLNFGNSEGDYNTQEMLTAMNRNELNAAFFLSQPGPKMIWQFGELGYDISIDFDCRTCPKPVLWNYFNQNHRKRLYDVYSAMNGLRRDYPNTFNSSNFSYGLGGAFKRINLYNDAMDAVVIGNFDVEPASGVPNFPYTGTWYEYFSGESIVENNLGNSFLLEPGEYRVYTSEPLTQPDITIGINELNAESFGVSVWPSLANAELNVQFDVLTEGQSLDIFLYDLEGREVKRFLIGSPQYSSAPIVLNVNDLAKGSYQLLIALDGSPVIKQFVKK